HLVGIGRRQEFDQSIPNCKPNVDLLELPGLPVGSEPLMMGSNGAGDGCRQRKPPGYGIGQRRRKHESYTRITVYGFSMEGWEGHARSLLRRVWLASHQQKSYPGPIRT